MEKSDEEQKALGFAILGCVDPTYSQYDLTGLALICKKDAKAKEELYSRIYPAIQRVVSYYSSRYSALEDGDALYYVYTVTERTLRRYNPDCGSFLSFWSYCIKNGLSGYCLRCEIRKPLPSSYADYDEPIYDPDNTNPGPDYEKLLDWALRSVDEAQTYKSLILILRLGGYSVQESSAMLGVSFKEARSASKLFGMLGRRITKEKKAG